MLTNQSDIETVVGTKANSTTSRLKGKQDMIVILCELPSPVFQSHAPLLPTPSLFITFLFRVRHTRVLVRCVDLDPRLQIYNTNSTVQSAKDGVTSKHRNNRNMTIPSREVHFHHHMFLFFFKGGRKTRRIAFKRREYGPRRPTPSPSGKFVLV